VDEVKENCQNNSELTTLMKKKDRLSDETEITRRGNERLLHFKEKLESICRDLQNQHKELLEETQKVKENETNKRKELQEYFDKSINEINEKVKLQSDDHEK